MEMTQGHRSLLDGFLLCGSVNLSSLLTLFSGPNLPGQTWAKEFQDLCLNLIATIATDNTMVVAYLRSGVGVSQALFVSYCGES